DLIVTGVQTCALPIYDRRGARDGRDDHRPVPERGLARRQRRGERRQVRLELGNLQAADGRELLPGAAALEQRFEQLRPLLLTDEIGRASCRERVYVSG